MMNNDNDHPLSHSLIALSTAFHEYNPLFISTFHSLLLLNGVDCIITKERSTSEQGAGEELLTKESSSDQGAGEELHDDDDDDNARPGQEKDLRTPPPLLLVHYILPISKCKIVGTIVYYHYKSNNSVAIVIDDGTGHCDCIGWSIQELLLVPAAAQDRHDHSNHQEDAMGRCQVGDIVEVQGAIKVLSLEKKIMVQHMMEHADGATNVYEGWSCFRELQIHSIRKVTNVNDEILHWLSCLQFQKRIGLRLLQDQRNKMSTDDDDDDTAVDEEVDVQEQLMKVPVWNGLDTLQSLSSQDEQLFMCSLIGGSDEHSPVSFKDQYERYFVQYYGRNCKCELIYKDTLLYCHCLATKEPLDPKFIFRDALLSKLVEMEKECIVVEKENEMLSKDDHGAASRLNDKSSVKRLEFQYSKIFRDEKLNALAKQVVSTTKDPGINRKRLYANTFRHLRNDGIVYLIDDRTDSYLLLSKDNVLLPAMIQYEIENDQWNYQHKILAASTSKMMCCPPQLPKFLQRSLSSAKLRLLQRLAKRQRST